MKKNNLFSLLILSCFSTTLGFAEEPRLINPPFRKLSLNQETYLTDKNGLVNPTAVAGLVVGSMVRIYRTDGTIYTGIITETIEEKDSLRIYGRANNAENTSFGFAMAKGGIFAGAIIEHNSETIYSLEFSEMHKGYIFLYTTKYDKKLI